MSPCELFSVTAVHRHVVVDIHALVVNPLPLTQCVRRGVPKDSVVVRKL